MEGLLPAALIACSVTTCFCCHHIQGSDIDNAMGCKRLSGSRSRDPSPPHCPTLFDASMIHPHCPSEKLVQLLRRGAPLELFVLGASTGSCRLSAPRSHGIETCGHLGKPIMRHIRTLSDVASARYVAVTRGSFLVSAYGELRATVLQSQGYVYRSCTLLLAKALGRQMLPGADTAFLD
jgi:hypothetical protein